MISFPSVKRLGDSFLDTILRYKIAASIALAKTILLIWLTETPFTNDPLRNTLLRLVFIAALTLPLALAIRLSEERQHWKPFVRPALIGLAAVLLGIYYVNMDPKPNLFQTYRFIILLAGAHLLVSYAPFLGTGDKEGFWQYNKTLFLQFLNASLYSGTLYVGLLIAIQTVRYLFSVEYKFAIEMDLFLTVSTFFHTIFFLSKIPRPDEMEADYPIGLKIFTQYVLLPLVVIYLAILYLYEAKIVVQWQLPQGQVAYLVLAFSIAGILALLLLYPLRQSANERWVTIFSQRYYLALLPLIILLFTGIFRRINDYGVTENRYIVAVLAIWLAGMTIYFISGERDDIRWIPITLSILCFLLPIGPWNIFIVSKNSQLKQFDEILTRNHVLNSRKQVAQRRDIPAKDREQLTSIVGFFRNRELTGLEPYFAGFKEKDRSNYQYYATMETTLEKYIVSQGKKDLHNYTNFSPRRSKNDGTISVAGYEHAVFIDPNQVEQAGDGNVEVRFQDFGKTWTLFRNGRKVTTWNIADRVSTLTESYDSNSEVVPQDSLTFIHENYKLVLWSLSSSDKFYHGNGILFYK